MVCKIDSSLNAVILVPRREGSPEREALWEYARNQLAYALPDIPIVEGIGPTDGPFNRSAAVNEAAGVAGDWDVALIVDADVVFEGTSARAALNLAYATDGPVLAYNERIQLNRNGTKRILGGYVGNWKLYRGEVRTDSVSSALAVSRSLWNDVGGFDPLFSGWGWEDTAFMYACETISEKSLVRIAAPLYHLWHSEPAERAERGTIWRRNKARGKLYLQANGDKGAIQQLLNEAQNV